MLPGRKLQCLWVNNDLQKLLTNGVRSTWCVCMLCLSSRITWELNEAATSCLVTSWKKADIHYTHGAMSNLLYPANIKNLLIIDEVEFRYRFKVQSGKGVVGKNFFFENEKKNVLKMKKIFFFHFSFSIRLSDVILENRSKLFGKY